MEDDRVGAPASEGAVLEYRSDPLLQPQRIWRSLPVISIALALISFPLGAGTSILMHAQRWGSSDTAERGGFLLFALGEGASAALACLAWARLRSARDGAAIRGRRQLTYAALALGGIGSAIVLLLIFRHAIQ